MKGRTSAKRKNLKKRLLVFIIPAAVVLLTSTDISGSKTTFTSGTTISASEMNSNFDALFNLANGNIDSANLASDSASLAKVSGGVMSESGGNISTTGNFTATGGIAAGAPSSSYQAGDIAADDDILADDDIFVGGGITVGSPTETAGTGDISAQYDIYAGGEIIADSVDVGNGSDGRIDIRNSYGEIAIELDVGGGSSSSDIWVKSDEATPQTGVRIQADDGGGDIALWNSESYCTIQLMGEYTNGNGRITLNGTQVNDYAEVFELSGKRAVQPGMVVVIDPDNPGNLRVSSEPYDKKVAGIISGAGGLQPGMVLGTREDGTNDKPVALSGRVYCYVDTSNGKIEAGDLLTTSSRKGYAMKATDFSKTQGAVLGKAMESFSGDEGLILVLVTLQ